MENFTLYDRVVEMILRQNVPQEQTEENVNSVQLLNVIMPQKP